LSRASGEAQEREIRSKFLLDIAFKNVTIAEDFSQQAAADNLAAMDRNNRTTPVGMTEKMMAPALTHNNKTELSERFDQALSSRSWERCHDYTAMRCTPTNSLCTVSPASRHTSMASVMRFMSTSSDFACVWQPRSSGTDAIK